MKLGPDLHKNNTSINTLIHMMISSQKEKEKDLK